MAIQNFLAIDIGTSSMKAAVFDEFMNNLFFGTVELPPESKNTPTQWLEAFTAIIKHIKLKVSSKIVNQLYITISGHGPSTIYLDKNNNPIHYISWQNMLIKPLPNENSYYLPQIIYVKNNMKKIFDATKTILTPAEYLIYMLSGFRSMCIPNSSFLEYYWTTEKLKKLGLSSQLVSLPLFSGTKIDKATTSFAKSLNLNQAQITTGGLDYMSAILGSGAVVPRKFLLRCGTSTILNICISKKTFSISNSNLKQNSMFTTYVLPSFYPNYYNIGITVPYYDLLYKQVIQYIPLSLITYQELSTRLNRSQSVTQPIVSKINSEIHSTKLNSNDIVNAVNNETPQNMRGETFLALLLLQLNSTLKIACEFYPELNRENFEITVSGGHASEINLMLLQSKILKIKINTYNPFYNELYGNLMFGLHAFNGSSYDRMLTQLKPDNEFIP